MDKSIEYFSGASILSAAYFLDTMKLFMSQTKNAGKYSFEFNDKKNYVIYIR